MRADRLVQIVMLLQSHRRLTAGEMAARLEVSARTIQRDLDALSSAGIPVYADRGRHGGWSLARDYRTRLDGLTPTEAASLFVSTTGSALADLGLGTASSSATMKLLSTVPVSAKAAAHLAQERVLIDDENWTPSGGASPWLRVLQQGLWESRTLELEYGSAPAPVRVDPLGLVAKKYRWYLVARREDGEYRRYRTDRVRRAVLSDETFDRPERFDLADHWKRRNEEYFESLRTYPVRLLVSNEVWHRLRWMSNAVIDHMTERSDGWWDVAMTFESRHETRVDLLGLAGDVVVLEPAELRDDMIDAAKTLLKDHDEPPTERNGREPASSLVSPDAGRLTKKADLGASSRG